ncbi:MAG: PhnD/SsuA/transferrin family substrate-binding protein [Pseudomonadota bacterium]
MSTMPGASIQAERILRVNPIFRMIHHTPTYVCATHISNEHWRLLRIEEQTMQIFPSAIRSKLTPAGRFIWKLAKNAVAVAFATTMLSNPSKAWAEISLTFGTYTADKPTATVRKFKPFLDVLAERMSEELGEPVVIRMKIAKTYAGGIAQLVNGEVDFARFGPASYITAKSQNDGVQIVTMESQNGEKRFNGVIAVGVDSTFQSLSDLEGHSFAFGDELSTIGRYLSQSHLLEAGVSSANLGDFEYLGRHDLVGEAVGAGRFAAGALKESTFKSLVEKGVPIRALFVFDNVTKPWLASSDMSPELVEAMRGVMLAAFEEEEILKIVKHGFLKGTDDDYNFVRQAMEASQQF